MVKENSHVINNANSQQGEKAMYNASQLTSNKRSMGNPADFESVHNTNSPNKTESTEVGNDGRSFDSAKEDKPTISNSLNLNKEKQ